MGRPKETPIEKLTVEIAVKKADTIEKYMEETLPRWYVKFVKRGGVFEWLATRLIKVYIIHERIK